MLILQFSYAVWWLNHIDKHEFAPNSVRPLAWLTLRPSDCSINADILAILLLIGDESMDEPYELVPQSAQSVPERVRTVFDDRHMEVRTTAPQSSAWWLKRSKQSALVHSINYWWWCTIEVKSVYYNNHPYVTIAVESNNEAAATTYNICSSFLNSHAYCGVFVRVIPLSRYCYSLSRPCPFASFWCSSIDVVMTEYLAIMDPLWMLSFFWLIGEVIIVLILCLPLPHAIRGLILRGFDAFEESANVRSISFHRHHHHPTSWCRANNINDE